ncbi:MAG: hypothetical protein LBK66_06875 [Spirochaetaceae bacterium]|jgi:hypothetical protein|nr:hypothetical protein [Spirochaetaceae bacterium]
MDLRNILNWLFGGAGDASKRHKAMKLLVKALKKNKYKSFYNIFSRNATQNLALYFYELYEACSQLQIKIDTTDGTQRLRNMVLRHFFDEEAMDIFMRLSNKYLIENFKLGDPKAIARQTEENIENLNEKLNSDWRENVDKCYHLTCSFIWLINFDYYYLLRNFNNNLKEHSFRPDQRFLKVKAVKILENLKDFIAVAEEINAEKDWKTTFYILNRLNRGADIQYKEWMDIFKKLEKVMSSNIFELIVCHAGSDPDWKNDVIVKNEKIAQLFLETAARNTRKTIQDILASERERSISDTVSFIFGGNKNARGAQFYVETWNEANRVKSAASFKHTVTFNYCIIFMSLFFKKIKSICDIYTIYGIWLNVDNMHILSQITHDLTILSIQLSSYDLSLSDLGEKGAKIKYLNDILLRTGKSTDRIRLSRYIDSVNDEVMTMINRIGYNLNQLSVFFLKFENKDGSLKNEIKNVKELAEMLYSDGYNISEIEKKTASFLNLLDFLEVELDSGVASTEEEENLAQHSQPLPVPEMRPNS